MHEKGLKSKFFADKYQAFWIMNCHIDNEELQKNHRETDKQANGGKSASPGTCQMTQEGKSSLDSNPLLICELTFTAQKKNAEVTANRPLKLPVDYALASKDMLGIIKKATSNKLKQSKKKSTYHTTCKTLRTEKLNLASFTSCI